MPTDATINGMLIDLINQGFTKPLADAGPFKRPYIENVKAQMLNDLPTVRAMIEQWMRPNADTVVQWAQAVKG